MAGLKMMRVLLYSIVMLMPLLAQAEGNDTKALGRVRHETVARAGLAFDPGQSRGLFIGINQYTAPRGVKPPNLKSCVNDAVDLAAAFMDLGLIEGTGITLALSGEPSKPSSVEALHRLLAAGAVQLPDARRDTISDAFYASAATAGADGILFLTWSAHGFETGGVQYLTPANFSSATERPSTAEIQGAGIAESTLAAIAQSSPAQRRVLLFDACRETKAMAVGIPQLVAEAVGTVTLYAVTSGELALDGTRNGAFTEKVLSALTGSPPPTLKADRNGHITIGTLLEYLGTAGRIEDTKILNMPLREDPRVAGQAEARDTALAHLAAAKQIELAAPRSDRMLDAISLGAFEDALYTDAGPALVTAATDLLDTPEKRALVSNRRYFAAAWLQTNPGASLPAAPAQPTPRSTPTSLGIDELLALQDQAKTEWERLQRVEPLENISAADKARFYGAYLTSFEQANYKLTEARERQQYWANWVPPSPTPEPAPTQDGQRSPAGSYMKSDSGVITDTRTNLQWIVGPDRDTNYSDAVKWVRNCTVDGGGWRMPTRTELNALYIEAAPTYNIDGAFGFSGWRSIWAEGRDPSSAWSFSYQRGREGWNMRPHSGNARAMGVRASP
jgi:hypothetical protein